MIPILFEHDVFVYQKTINNQTALNHGIGDLAECISCTAKINDEGEFELQLKYPVTGSLFKELSINRIILAKVPYSNKVSPYQAFRIYGYEKNLNGIITIKCQHVSYDMADVPIKAFDTVYYQGSYVPVNTAINAMKAMMDNVPAGVSNPFNYTGSQINPNQQNSHLRSDVTGYPHTEDNKFVIHEPKSMRSILLDGEESIKGCWGGDLVFDNFVATLYKTGGYDNGVTLEYGIDIIDLSLEEEISELATGVFPYWKGEIEVKKGTVTERIEKIVYGNVRYAREYNSQLTFEKEKIIPLDLSEFYQDDIYSPTDQTKEATLINLLNQKALEWMEAEEIGQPEFTVSISHINDNYTGYIKDIKLYDAIRILFPKMGIAVKAKVSSFTYDVLAECCTDIEITHGVHQSKWRGLEDASRLKRGLIPPSRIANRSIENRQIATGAVGGRTIATGGVGAGKLGKDSVDTDNVKDSAVTDPKVETATADGSKGISATKLRQAIQDQLSTAVETASIVSNTITVDKAKGNIITCNFLVCRDKWGNPGLTVGQYDAVWSTAKVGTGNKIVDAQGNELTFLVKSSQ